MSKREKYIKELKGYIDVDIFGACSKVKNPCPSKNKKGFKCLEKLSQKYKFYLAFENSICEEYITEKIQRTLEFPIVPVVMGAGSYERYFPNGSYINVFDFQSPKHLADYLHFLNKNQV